MSKVAIQGNASGTGTFTIAAPNSNTDRTLTLPDEAGTVLTSASSVTKNQVPSYAYAYTQLSTSNPDDTSGAYTYTGGPIRWDQVNIDNQSIYSTSTGKFTIPTTGIYRITVVLLRADQAGETYYRIYKNGSELADSGTYTNLSGAYFPLVLDTMFELNASDEVWVQLGTGGVNQNAASSTQWNHCIVQELP